MYVCVTRTYVSSAATVVRLSFAAAAAAIFNDSRAAPVLGGTPDGEVVVGEHV